MLKKRTLALLLSLTMLLSLLTPTAFATGDEEPGTTQEEVVAPTGDEQNDDQNDNQDQNDQNEKQDEQSDAEDEKQSEDEDETKDEPSQDGNDQPEPTDPEQGEQPEQPDQPTEEPGEPENPDESQESEFDAAAVYAQLMACETAEEMDAIAAELTEEQIAQFSDEQLADIEAHYAELKGEEPVEEPEEDVVDNGIVDFTDVAPFLEPVQGEGVRNILMAAVKGAVATYEDEKDNGIKLIKSATPKDNGSYTIRMEAYATGESVTTVVSEDVPTDIVLVLDQSGSMKYCMVCGKENSKTHTAAVYEKVYSVRESNNYYCLFDGTYTEVEYCDGNHFFSTNDHVASWVPTNISSSGTDHRSYVRQNGVISPKTSADGTGTQFYTRTTKTENCTSRLNALKTAVTQFAEAVATKAKGADGKLNTDDDVKHRIAIVGFASQSGNGNNTELLSIGGKNSGNVGVAYNSITNQNLKDVMQRMDTTAGQTMVTNAIDALAASGATRTDLGMDMAKRILDANPVTEADGKRNRVVIVFTDGSPTSGSGFQVDTAGNAISKADEIKNGGTTIYTIGVFAGADASTAGTKPSQNLSKTSPLLPAACNWFMQKLSSNNGTPQSPSYYLSPSDSDSLNSIFQQISDKINTDTSSTTLDANSVIKDVVTPYFTMPSGADVKVYTQNFGENGFDGIDAERTDLEATVDITGDTVSVTGFSFKDNWCGTKTDENNKVTYHGQKLIIEFTVWPKDGFLGGNNVPTNGEKSGIYKDATEAENGEPVGTFPEPKVNVPIKDVVVKVSAKEKNLYYGTTLTEDQMLDGATATSNGTNLWGLDPNAEVRMDQFVTVETTVNDNGFDGTEDGSYTITVTVRPKDKDAEEDSKGTLATETSGSATANINVFKPEITWRDSAIELGEEANYEEDNFVSVVWKHGNVPADVSTMGAAPGLIYGYSTPQGAFTVDTPVKVTVKLLGVDITPAVTFVRKACGFAGCDHTEDTTILGTETNRVNFIVHIKPFDLTIKKTGWEEIDENQAFVFHVTSTDAKVDMYVTINFKAGDESSKSVTIKDLKPGNYTITEESGWSWRYEVTDGASKTIKPENVGISTPGQARVSFTNDRTESLWLNGCSYAVNRWVDGHIDRSN